ncbi:YceI family protein [Thalassobellus suaedae]|uniref:YceI family protein n=1 Tax=Thalassobellus suaedae TaxID=3074124 RepID=A0ABY9Y3L8_9FLAO|nr:YceI family protein [Flavobacteriaceae bacterium HL-DH14]WNH12434.1 YceI family protein [Flavobacteriaceae bacterium HL-DH10]
MYKNPKLKLLRLLVLFFFTVSLSQAQQYDLNNKESVLTVLGTSSLHDWHITSENQSGKIVFTNLNTCEIESLNISIIAESLKSGKSSMDKNTYKALKTNKYKANTFQLVKIKEVKYNGNGKFSVKSLGDLTITGVKKQISLDFNMNITSDKISLVGEKKIKMTDFNIDPPKALFGTITTGDDLTIEFSTIFR